MFSHEIKIIESEILWSLFFGSSKIWITLTNYVSFSCFTHRPIFGNFLHLLFHFICQNRLLYIIYHLYSKLLTQSNIDFLTASLAKRWGWVLLRYKWSTRQILSMYYKSIVFWSIRTMKLNFWPWRSFEGHLWGLIFHE